MEFRESRTEIKGYHAHIYYRPQTKDDAGALRQAIGDKFDVTMGRWHDVPVGPHPMAMYQVAFSPALFDELVPWLMINRFDLDVLVHPETGDDLKDHRDHALWLGSKLSLKFDLFEQQQQSV